MKTYFPTYRTPENKEKASRGIATLLSDCYAKDVIQNEPSSSTYQRMANSSPQVAQLVSIQDLANKSQRVGNLNQYHQMANHPGSSIQIEQKTVQHGGKERGADQESRGGGEGASIGPIQRKIGFEFQVSKNKFVDGISKKKTTHKEANKTTANYGMNVPISHIKEKEVAYHEPGLFKLEGDDETDHDSQLEFVTYPADTIKDLLVSIKAAAQLAHNINSLDKREDDQLTEVKGGEWTRSALMDIKDPAFGAEPQMSIGVELEDIPDLLAYTRKGKNQPSPEKVKQEQAKFLGFNEEAAHSKEENKIKQFSPKAQGFLTLINEYVEAAAMEDSPVTLQESDGLLFKPSAQPTTSKEEESPKKSKFNFRLRRKKKKEVPKEVKPAFSKEHVPPQIPAMNQSMSKYMANTEELFYINKSWHDLYVGGPKQRFRVMARTDFRSMFKSLPPKDQEAVFTLLLETPTVITKNPNIPLLYTPYSADDRIVQNEIPELGIQMLPNAKGDIRPVVMKSPTVHQWFKSIVSEERGEFNGQNKDLLSAPPGWAGHKGEGFPSAEEIQSHHIYGMGAYPMDNSKAVFEIRDIKNFSPGGMVSAEGWEQWVISQLVKYMNNQMNYSPPFFKGDQASKTQTALSMDWFGDITEPNKEYDVY